MGDERARPVLQIIGDGMQGRWLTWRWSGPEHPVGVRQLPDPHSVLERFRAALPADGATLAELNLDGPLTCPEAELELMRSLATVLLPEELLEQLRTCDERIQVRVMPSPPLAQVPWGLLPIDGDRRLIEVADISWMGPILPRDIGAEPEPSRHGDGPDVIVVDPFVAGQGFVHSTRPRAEDWAHHPEAQLLGRFTPGILEEHEVLERMDDASGLLLIGHVSQEPGHPGETSFNTAQDRLGAKDVIFSDTRVPPRVAIVACASGVDLQASEPLGLATGLLLKGAEVVLGTLWVLPTEHALGLQAAAAAPAFCELERAFDVARHHDDPVAGLCGYQRERLRAWREQGGLRNSPILWGAAMALTAPRQRHLGVVGKSQETTDLGAAEL
ncbi:MAG: CHAT domain-containing protein [Propionibacteriaceae bacterium]|nr:CHAT domain-containing protein [Propionibacteriaceae bacterium]